MRGDFHVRFCERLERNAPAYSTLQITRATHNQNLQKSCFSPTHHTDKLIDYILKNEILNQFDYFSTLKKCISKMNRIKEVLEEKGIKQIWLAEKLGKSYNMVNAYVQNRQQPRLEVLFEIAQILDVDAKELLKDSNFDGKE